MKKDVFLKYVALAPITHLEPPQKGTKVAKQRKVKFTTWETQAGATNLKIIDLPVPSSGNAHRAVARRMFMTHVLKDLEFYNEQTKIFTGLPRDVFEALLAGGRQGKGSNDRNVNAYRFANIYNDLPFFGLFGGCLGGTFFPGRLGVGFVYPVTSETILTLKEMNSPFISEMGNKYEIAYQSADLQNSVHRYNRSLVNNIDAPMEKDFTFVRSVLSDYPEILAAFEEEVEFDPEPDENGKTPKNPFTQTTAGLKADQQATEEIFKALDLKIKEGDSADKKVTEIIKFLRKTDTIQMIYSTEGSIPVGTIFHSRVSLLEGYGNDDLMEMAFDAYVDCMLERGFLGGQRSKGYGFVSAEARTAGKQSFESRGDEFWAWIKENKDDLRQKVIDMKRNLTLPMDTVSA